ncbi:glycosyltransferase family 2 protein [Microbacterium sp. VKM Ac-2870]|uniref:glycosyltransferase family 2 protein n=1 Tax=Microbacterium sp. VKM Ac-2870 TaxID=2783825 RepID=UPI00188CA3CE|nr:glycosyltransferase family 2 protein [Microbacterium sp. VKM Ac-2870]MBF4561665.1 glycosyltransferase family 2 protein [Microbacterium sp. VKM Ac-2870]
MTVPELSIVVPVRNGMPYLPDAIGSALAELPPDGELVVRDNCSTDGTAAWLAAVDDPRLRVITGTDDLTAGQNWTAVAKEASGTFVKLLCADDFVTPGGVARQLAAARETGATMVASRRRVVDGDDRVVMTSHGLGGLIGIHEGRRALAHSVSSGTNAFGEPSAVLMRRDALLAALPFTSEFPYLTDLDLYARVLAQGTFVGLASVDAGFRISATSWSSAVGNAQLREFRSWVEARIVDGGLTLTRTQRAKAGVMIPAKFVARRIVNEFSSRAAARRAAARS